MCGIAGVLSGRGVEEPVLRAMAGSLRHRGPDDEGIWVDPTTRAAGLVHRRLSIVDLSAAGHQPMATLDGRYVMVFNGEMYNYLELRAELAGAGITPQWRGHSDTETLLECFAVWGIEPTLRKSVGMFALAVWDCEEQVLTLARDRLGEKPLYYGWQNGTFIFGSELAALRAHPAFSANVNRDALAAFLRYGYVPAPYSIYRDVHKLAPGTLLRITPRQGAMAAPRAYWSLAAVAREGLQEPFVGSEQDAIDELETRLSRAVSLQQVADVPLGAFLSGGVDSSMIVALMQAQSSSRVHTFTIGFEDPQYDESAHARAVARHLGTDHTELKASADDARRVIPQLPRIYDEPFADVSQIPTFLVSQLARRSVTVSLSGDGGDELFGGYNRYARVRQLLGYSPTLRKTVARGLTVLSPSQWDRTHAALARFLPASLGVRTPGDKAHKLAGILEAGSAAALYQRMVSAWPDPDLLVKEGSDPSDVVGAWQGFQDFDAPENRMMVLDALTYLPGDVLCKVDRAAMAVSLETRVPFLDHRVVAFAWSLQLSLKLRDGTGKWIVRRLLDKYVPRELIERPKMGFAVPIDAWLRGSLRDWAESLLDDKVLGQQGYLHATPIRTKWLEHLSGKRNWQAPLWNVLMFQAWLAAQHA